QRRLHLPQEADLRRGHRAPLEGHSPGQRQEGDALRPLLPRPRLPPAGDVRGRGNVLPEGAHARPQSGRGLLRAGTRLLVGRRPRPRQANLAARFQSQPVQSLGQEVRGDARAGAPGPGTPAPTRAKYDSLTQGRLPSWSEGAAFPGTGAVVLLTSGPPDHLTAALRHELAHVVLRWRVRRPLPLWFEEGYAAVAAGEWDRL